jgi:hypothetical protein
MTIINARVAPSGAPVRTKAPEAWCGSCHQAVQDLLEDAGFTGSAKRQLSPSQHAAVCLANMMEANVLCFSCLEHAHITTPGFGGTS